MPFSAVNDSESLRYTIRTMQYIARTALAATAVVITLLLYTSAYAAPCPRGMHHSPTQDVCNYPAEGVKAHYPQPRSELLNWRQYQPRGTR